MPCAENDFRLIKCKLVNLSVSVCLAAAPLSPLLFPYSVSLGRGGLWWGLALPCSLEEGGGPPCRAGEFLTVVSSTVLSGGSFSPGSREGMLCVLSQML